MADKSDQLHYALNFSWRSIGLALIILVILGGMMINDTYAQTFKHVHAQQAMFQPDSAARQEITTLSFRVDSGGQFNIELWVQLDGGMMMFHEGVFTKGVPNEVKQFKYIIPNGSKAFWYINKQRYGAARKQTDWDALSRRARQ